jgi:protoporphyrinogen oxidase
MTQERPADRLMEKLLRAIELSLKATEASREAVQEILKRGAETGIFFTGTRTETADGFDLTEQDRDFLRSLSIRPDPR